MLDISMIKFDADGLMQKWILWNVCVLPSF